MFGEKKANGFGIGGVGEIEGIFKINYNEKRNNLHLCKSGEYYIRQACSHSIKREIGMHWLKDYRDRKTQTYLSYK